jgi:hypothetical protein
LSRSPFFENIMVELYLLVYKSVSSIKVI